MDLDLSAYNGIALQVEGDGQNYKLNLKTADQENVPEDTFQATFDTIAGAAISPPCMQISQGRISGKLGGCRNEVLLS